MILCLLIAFGWQSISSSPDLSPPVPEGFFDYPDSFALQAEYLSRFAIRHHQVQQGDTLREIFQKLDLPRESLEQWQRTCEGFSGMNCIHPNDEITVYVGRRDQQPVKFVYASIDGSSHVFRKMGDDWSCEEGISEPFTIIETVKETITDNLYDSCLRAGLPPGLIMQMADLFAYDIDFTSDIREGDSFAVHFEEKVGQGKRVDAGPILAAEMEIDGGLYQAFLYRFSDGYVDYFDAQGHSLRKLFLKAPLSYSRISSSFTYRRLHPILRIFRPHLGIDYAAPAGTPVSALGEGVISYLGRKGGFGKYIAIRHNSLYTTTYGHLSSYASGLRKGSRVNQGDVIGFVGSSGMATGPHLDFRFYKDGRPIDFLKTDFPHARSIPPSMRSDFEKKREHYLAALHAKQFVSNARNKIGNGATEE